MIYDPINRSDTNCWKKNGGLQWKDGLGIQQKLLQKQAYNIISNNKTKTIKKKLDYITTFGAYQGFFTD